MSDAWGIAGRASSLLLLAAACSTPEPAPTPSTAGESAGQGTGSESSTAATLPAQESSDESESSGPALDLDDGPSEGAGCTKVDLLFVVDNSYSMATKQGALIESFPVFMDDLYATLDATDSYHVAVVTSDAYAFNTPGCQEMGALVGSTGGQWSSQAVCGPYSGGVYMTDEEELGVSFSCAAQVGIDGAHDERPIEAMLEALGPTHAQGCNLGFRREDALLVIVLITDEEDDHTELFGDPQGSPGDPADWFAAVEELVGIEENAVVLTICGGHPDDACGFVDGAAEDSPRLRGFTQMFTHAYLGDICAGNFGSFFEEAVAVVDLACENFTPVP